MSLSFAVTFEAPFGAERALTVMRRWQRQRLVQLDDACLAVRRHSDTDPLLARPRLDLRVGLPNRLLGRTAQPRLTLNPERVRLFAQGLAGNSSALVVLVRRIDSAALRTALPSFLATHNARLRRLEAPAANPEAPSAAELRAAALAHQQALMQQRQARSSTTQSAQAARIARFMDPRRADEAVGHLLQHCRNAARQGRLEVLAYRFPSAVLSDRGRAVHAGDPIWPRTLQGEPAAVFRFVEQTLLPKGYAATAVILDYPEGLLGDVGFFLRWGHGDA